MASGPPSELPEAHDLALDRAGIACLSCGYDLSGLPDNGACPECAHPIALSRSEKRFWRNADAMWLGRVERGLRLLARGSSVFGVLVVVGLSIAIGSLLFVLLAAWLSWDLPSLSGWFGDIAGAAVLGSFLFGVVLCAVGAFLVSTPPSNDRLMPRWALLSARWIGALAVPILVAMELVQHTLGTLPSWFPAVLANVLFGVGLFGVAGIMRVVQRLEQGTPLWDARRRGSYRNMYKNLIGTWLIFGPVCTMPLLVSGRTWRGGTVEWGPIVLVLTLVLLRGAFLRVRGGVSLELRLSEEIRLKAAARSSADAH